MRFFRHMERLAFGMTAALLASSPAWADEMTMWVRASAANAAPHMTDLWNASHPDSKINLTVIPDTQMVTKLATGVAAGQVPDLISFDLIYMPDFMKAGFLIDITDQMKADPNAAKVATAFADLATYQGREYGTGFTPEALCKSRNSLILWGSPRRRFADVAP